MGNRYADFFVLAEAWYRRCDISSGERVLIATDTGTDHAAVDAFFSVAVSLGAEAIVAMCGTRRRPFSDVPPLFEEAMMKADFIHELFTWVWSSSESKARVMRKIQTTGQGRMTWGGGELEDLDTAPDERVIERSRVMAEILNAAKRIQITSELGTDLTFHRGDPEQYLVVRHGGDCDEPGRVGGLAGGVTYMLDESSANGVLHIDGAIECYDRFGSANWLVDEPVKLQVEDGYIVHIDTANQQGKWLDEWFKRFHDPEVKLFTSTNIGLDHRVSLRPCPGGVAHSHSVQGCLVMSFGRSLSPLLGAAHRAPGRIDLVIKGVNYFVDGKRIMSDGEFTEESGLA